MTQARRLRAGLLQAALGALIVLPWLPRLCADVPVLGAATRLLDGWFAYQCHREPARTWAGLSVCVRCYGIYFGLGSGALIQRPKLEPFAYRVWLVTAALVLLLDVLTEALGMRPAWALLRFVSGALLGYPVGSALVLAANQPKPTDPR